MLRQAQAVIGRVAFGVLALTTAGNAWSYGQQGHLIAGQVAEEMLCERARTEVDRLGEGQDLGELGLWADRIRSDRAYVDSAPWHYMNIATGVAASDFEHPPEGDVLWAIEKYAERMVDASLGRREQSDALKFFVHFLVDIHQPLHVGLADDRGGNSVSLRFRGETTNLHRMWDSHAIEWAGQPFRSYRREVRRAVRDSAGPVSLDPIDWIDESLTLRSAVYDFGEANRELSAAYLDFAASTTRDRLVLASLRLAGTLNAAFCR